MTGPDPDRPAPASKPPMTSLPPTASETASMPLPKFLSHPDDLCDQWLDESYELDEGDPAWDREDMQSAYREGRDEARRQLAHPWADLATDRDKLAAELQGVHGELRAAGIGGDPANHWAPLLVSTLARQRDEARQQLAGAQERALARDEVVEDLRADLRGAREALQHIGNRDPEILGPDREWDVHDFARHALWAQDAGLPHWHKPAELKPEATDDRA